MGKHTIFVVSALTLVWCILMEGFSWQNMAIGMMVSLGCMHVYVKFLPFREIEHVNFFKLATLPFYLVGQIYLAGFYVMKVILTGPKVDIVTVRTQIRNEALRVMLVDCITLTPGSILLELKDDLVTLLWIRDKNTPGDPDTADKLLKGRLEKRLQRAERK